ncbi:hypothetical protein VOLCADRAFT_109764 [Volvox carteri f. nagariensis]|uniref:PCI domain-containing protein n=1 Tax=Volvox carteri f. nagariensis TaxID=3068 RepID=D8TV76_VOLCA|nr:uncharacterized protein VOLCADRAFT_109764 [Volvox carteri f. nagariensis]EFJ48655.1 hypothetical protein VOLCADRAFT_109764 [Volvox carteri f. nagariensis]|eukprot:XP_002950454.1 hypothetical protein VOLCADRAFT_109764 [Volvox carteri f. nagariensis]
MPLQLVETSDEDSFVSVAHHLAELLNEGQTRTALADTPATIFLNDCVNLVQEQRYEEYVSRISSQVNTIYTKMTDKEAECCLSIAVHAVGRVPNDGQQAAATTLANALCQSDERAEERLTALLSLYGILSSQPAAQLAVLLATAGYAARNSAKCRATFCSAVRGKAQRWVAQWQLGPSESRQLYLALAAAMRGASDRPTTREHLALVSLALSLPGTSDKAPEVVEAAAGALADYLRSSSVYTLDLLPLPAVAALADSPKYAPLHKLVTTVVAGDVAGARDASASAALEAAGGVSTEAVLSKARMTALLAACARAGHGEVALGDLRVALDVPEDQVQSWIVRAIGAKLLEGRVDSVRGTVSVARSTHPCFGQAQWSKLATQLAALKETVATAAAAMSQVRPPQHVIARAASVAAAREAAAASRA